MQEAKKLMQDASFDGEVMKARDELRDAEKIADSPPEKRDEVRKELKRQKNRKRWKRAARKVQWAHQLEKDARRNVRRRSIFNHLEDDGKISSLEGQISWYLALFITALASFST